MSHSGADAGYRSHSMRFPGEKLSVTVLCNAAVNPVKLAQDVAALHLEGKLEAQVKGPEAAPKVDVPNTELEKAAGLYLNRENEEVMRLTVKDGKLMMSISGEGELIPTGPGKFRPVDAPWEVAIADDWLTLMAPGLKAPDRFRRVAEWTPSAEELKTLAGSYYSEELDSTYKLALQDGQLKLLRKKLRTHDVKPTFADALYVRFLGFVRFERGTDGRIIGFRITSGRIRNLGFRKTE